MPQTINQNADLQIIGGTFSRREKADQATVALQELGVPQQNIEVLLLPDDKASRSAYASILQNRGVAETQAAYYDNAINEGKIFVAVYNVTDPTPIIEVFDRYGAEFNPDGSRNVRQDVAGMTAGAAAGAVVGGAIHARLGNRSMVHQLNLPLVFTWWGKKPTGIGFTSPPQCAC